MRVLVFGDSIAHGYWDARGGWVQRLRAQYDAESVQNLHDDFAGIYNLSLAGETARGVIRRLPYEVKSRQDHEELAIMIAIGMNDTMIYKGVEATPAELFTGELLQIFEAAIGFTDRILFVGLTAVNEKECNPWPYSPQGACFSNNRISGFNAVIKQFCKSQNIAFIDVFQKFKKQMTTKELLADGLHPNDAGHELIAKLVAPKLQELLN